MLERTLRLASTLLAVAFAACVAPDATTDGSDADADATTDGSPGGDGGGGDADTTPPAGRRVFFSFAIGGPDDPPQQHALLVDSVEKVAAAIGRVTDPSFESTVLVGAPDVSPATVTARLAEYARTLEADDTFVMYSHGHGLPRGLVLDFESTDSRGVRWEELAELVLALPARNVVVFTMSCHSGAFADLLKTPEYATRWQGRSLEGRSFVVATAVAADEIASATDFVIGDPESIGNPFTYAVHTAIDGRADGFGAVPDGVTTLREAVDYVLHTAQAESRDGQHHPQVAGDLVEAEPFPTGD